MYSCFYHIYIATRPDSRVPGKLISGEITALSDHSGCCGQGPARRFDDSEPQRLSQQAELCALRAQYDHLALHADPDVVVINVDHLDDANQICKSRGLGWRIHESVEDTKLSTNKQHTLSSSLSVCVTAGRGILSAARTTQTSSSAISTWPERATSCLQAKDSVVFSFYFLLHKRAKPIHPPYIHPSAHLSTHSSHPTHPPIPPQPTLNPSVCPGNV